MLQAEDKILEKRAALVFAALLCAAVLFWLFPKALLVVVGCGAGAVVALKIAERTRLQREAAARAAAYANICGPVVIASMHPGETVAEVQQRAEDFREQMRIGGNPYASQIPVIVYPYEPMIFGPGQLTAGWNIYQRLAGEKQHAANQQWADRDCPPQLKQIFLSQVMPAPPQQDGEGWENVKR